jgi:hypothetical protein
MSYTEDKSTTPPRSRHHQRAMDSLHLLQRYVKNPVQAMRELPDWDWSTLLFFFMSVAAICGFLGAIVSRHLLAIIPGIIVLPISSTLAAFCVTGFFYYTYAFFFHREIALKTLFTIVALASLPVLVTLIFSSWLIPLNLVGFLASGMLLVVGLTENTHVDRRKLMKLVGAIYLVYVVFWVVSTIRTHSEREEYKDPTSNAVEILEKEKNN